MPQSPVSWRVCDGGSSSVHTISGTPVRSRVQKEKGAERIKLVSIYRLHPKKMDEEMFQLGVPS